MFAVTPLPVPASDAIADLEALAEFASVQLFIDRAQVSRPDFQLTRRNSADVARLCMSLEGIPLAIELAAAWAQILSPAQMCERLSARFELLTPRPQAASRPGRQRSLLNTVGWSYDLLAPDLRQFLARLSVFRGGWTSDTAQAVAVQPEQAMDYLAQLCDRSLVSQ